MSELLSLIIPCFNEERTLASCVGRCLALKEHGLNLERFNFEMFCIHKK